MGRFSEFQWDSAFYSVAGGEVTKIKNQGPAISIPMIFTGEMANALLSRWSDPA
jgi:hypothetical protein